MIRSWKEQKNEICMLIKKISDHCGGDDIEWLREYCLDLIETNKDQIQKLLDCCWEIEDKLKFITIN